MGRSSPLRRAGRKLYIDAEGALRKPGSLIKNNDLARTLGLIAREGADIFYHGTLADHISSDIARNGGLLSKADLENCIAEQEKPLDVTYRGRRFSTVPAPGGGLYVPRRSSYSSGST